MSLVFLNATMKANIGSIFLMYVFFIWIFRLYLSKNRVWLFSHSYVHTPNNPPYEDFPHKPSDPFSVKHQLHVLQLNSNNYPY